MIGNLKEQFLFERLPSAVISGDEKGLIQAVLGGFQDRLEDLRSFTKKISEFYVPGALPDGPANAVLVDLISAQGKAYTRSLDIQLDTPADGDPKLPQWAAGQLGLDVSDVSNVRYGRDLLRLVDANLLSYLAATLGAVLYQSVALTDTEQTAANTKLVDTWFPRLKFKGTARSFDMLGRILGFDDVRVTPLWTRLSPRIPDNVGDSANDSDFSFFADHYPQQDISPVYDPFEYRDGPFFQWEGTSNNRVDDTGFYSSTINGRNPFVEIVLLGSLSGTNIPAIVNGTITQPMSGTYTLAGGAPNLKAFVDPPGGSIRIQALAEGDDFNGLTIEVTSTGTQGTLFIIDRLSSIKYRSSYFDVSMTASMDRIEEVFGSRAASTNKNLQADPTLTSDGTAISPYRPWVGGSVSVQRTTADYLVASGSNTGVVSARAEADPTVSRQLNMDSVTAAGVQVVQAFEEVRAATRQIRRSAIGFTLDDPAEYAAYVRQSLLFVSASGTLSYSGSNAGHPLAPYVVNIEIVNGTGTQGLAPEIDSTGTVLRFAAVSFSGSYDLRTEHFGFTFSGTAPNGASVYAIWIPTSTELIRPEPATFADKAYEERPEDDGPAGSGFVYEVSDDFGWRRDLVVGGELVELDIYRSGTELGIDRLDEVTSFSDHTGIDVNVFVVKSKQTPHPRFSTEARSTGLDYRPGYNAVGYQGTFKNLAAYTGTDTTLPKPHGPRGVGDTANDYDTLFQPGYGLYHVGIAQGVLVADLPKFFGPQHRDSIVGWFPFNEHVDDDKVSADRSPKAQDMEWRSLANSNLDYYDRKWDDIRGWVMSLENGVLVSDKYRDIADQATVSFWIKLQANPLIDTEIVSHGPISFTVTSLGAVKGYVNTASSAVQIGTTGNIADGNWHFVYIRRVSGTAVFGFGTLSASPTENSVANAFLSASTNDTLLTVNGYISGTSTVVNGRTVFSSYQIHDLRLWNVQKTAAQMDLVRYHKPTPTICTYRLGFAYTADRSDKYGLRILSSGWATLDFLPASQRRTDQGLVRRYDSMGSYFGESRFKETGIGDSRQLPTTFKLGQQYTSLTAAGTAPFSTDHGQLPGYSDYWNAPATGGNYVRLVVSGSTGTGINASVTASGTASPWPNTMAQTNPFRESVWVKGVSDNNVYELRLSGSGSSTVLAASRVVRARSQTEAIADPYIDTLIDNGTIWQSFGTLFIQGTLIGSSGTYGTYDPLTTISRNKVFDVNSLFVSEVPTGAYVLLASSGSNGILVADPNTMLGTEAAYSGTLTTPPLYMYLNSRVNVQVPNAYTAWTDRNAATPTSNSVDISAMPTIVWATGSGTFLNLPVLGKNGLLEFENNSNLPAGNYVLRVESGNVGQPDDDFQGFDVEITLNSAIQSEILLNGRRAYNLRGIDEFPFTLTDSVNGNWLLTFDWTNALTDVNKGTKRQLAIFSYSLRRIFTEAFKITIAGTHASPIIQQLFTDNYTSGTTPGGWFATINSYGTQTGYQHEATMYPGNDTVVSASPISDLLTGMTNDRRIDVIYVGADARISDSGSFSFPSFASITASPSKGSYQVGDVVSFTLQPPYSGTAIYSYVWDFWDAASTATVGQTVVKVINIGGVPGFDSFVPTSASNNAGVVNVYLRNITDNVTAYGTDVVMIFNGGTTVGLSGFNAGPHTIVNVISIIPGGSPAIGSPGSLYYQGVFQSSFGYKQPDPIITGGGNNLYVLVGTPVATGTLALTCTPVALDGRSTIYHGSIVANNPPTLFPGATVTKNDQFFAYQTRISVTAYDVESSPIHFAWFTGTNFVGFGTSTFIGPVIGTWSGDGTTIIAPFSGTSNYIDNIVSQNKTLTCYLRDEQGGTSTVDFNLRGQPAPVVSASLTAGIEGLVVDTSTLPAQRIGDGQTILFTVYAKDPANGSIDFHWTFAGSNNWTMGPSTTNGTTTATADGGFQNNVLRDISAEVIASGTAKLAKAVVDVISTNLTTGEQRFTESEFDVQLFGNNVINPANVVVVLKLGTTIIPDGTSVPAGSQIEYSVQAQDPDGDVLDFEWQFPQPFAPSTLTAWGAKIVYDTSGYTTGDIVQGTLTITDRVGGQVVVSLPILSLT